MVTKSEKVITIENYYKGMPCIFGTVLGKIVGESEAGSWQKINGVNMYSIPLFATPAGTVVKIGLAYLTKITAEGLDKLNEYESEIIKKGGTLYGGHLG